MASARTGGLNENIRTYNSAGGAQHTTLASWEIAYADEDLVTAQVTEWLEAEAGEHDDRIVFSGGTTSPDYFAGIRAAPGAESKGKTYSGTSAYFKTTSPGYVVQVLQENVHLSDIEFSKNADTTTTQYFAYTNKINMRSVGVMFYECTNIGTGSGAGILNYAPDCTYIDCVFSKIDTLDHITTQAGKLGNVFRNCTFTESRFAINAGGECEVINCLADQTTHGSFQGSYTGSSDYNASDDATAPGANSRQNQTFTFVDHANGDFHLDAADLGALGFGTDLSVDFDDDIDLEVIGDWSIGADSEAGATQLVGSDGSASSDSSLANMIAEVLAPDGGISADTSVLTAIANMPATEGSVSSDNAIVSSIADVLSADGSISSDSSILGLRGLVLGSDGSLSSDAASINFLLRGLVAEGSLSSDISSVYLRVRLLASDVSLSADLGLTPLTTDIITSDGSVSSDIGTISEYQSFVIVKAVIDLDQD